MEFHTAKEEFIQAWGSLGSSWGVSRTMAMLHALLLVSPNDLSADEIMEELQISRGNTNMNLRALIDWGLVEKVQRKGERKEYFKAYKDIWLIATNIARERKKRELAPIKAVLQKVKQLEKGANINEKKGQGLPAEQQEFVNRIEDIAQFAGQAETALDMFIGTTQSKWFKTLMKLKN